MILPINIFLKLCSTPEEVDNLFGEISQIWSEHADQATSIITIAHSMMLNGIPIKDIIEFSFRKGCTENYNAPGMRKHAQAITEVAMDMTLEISIPQAAAFTYMYGLYCSGRVVPEVFAKTDFDFDD